jgi:hypothetical protein
VGPLRDGLPVDGWHGLLSSLLISCIY